MAIRRTKGVKDVGTVIHVATIVTSFISEMLGEARDEAIRIFPREMVTDIGISPVNKYYTFVILPCGSKEGWGEKARDDDDRAEFMHWVDGKAYEDGSNALEVGTARYGYDLESASDGTKREATCHGQVPDGDLARSGAEACGASPKAPRNLGNPDAAKVLQGRPAHYLPRTRDQ